MPVRQSLLLLLVAEALFCIQFLEAMDHRPRTDAAPRPPSSSAHPLPSKPREDSTRDADGEPGAATEFNKRIAALYHVVQAQMKEKDAEIKRLKEECVLGLRYLLRTITSGTVKAKRLPPHCLHAVAAYEPPPRYTTLRLLPPHLVQIRSNP